MMSKLKLRWGIYLILIGHKGATELRRAKTFILIWVFFFHNCQSWSKFDTLENKFHANPNWDFTKFKNFLGHTQAIYNNVYWARFVAWRVDKLLILICVLTSYTNYILSQIIEEVLVIFHALLIFNLLIAFK